MNWSLILFWWTTKVSFYELLNEAQIVQFGQDSNLVDNKDLRDKTVSQ